ncbi:olfactory receptor 1009-like [Alligator sinensis]|uniref:Olfactory receptor n=1 Tax=Alligator sinensis TaxID=38654 RepID=A0A1U7STS6_ALLSI|nr:olfactory receptor 1009-like [Alligator sinensis]
MEKGKGSNQTFIMELTLLGFGNAPDLQAFLSLMFLMIYIVTIAGNILIVVLVVIDNHLHTPMYFFLGNLSCLETCYTSTILPRMLAAFLTGDRTISVRGCITQMYFFGCLATTECYLLAVMSYDRYLAICKPLLYAALMNSRGCVHLTAGSWIGGLISSLIITYFTSQLTFCGPNEIDHFFCDLTPILQLSCSDTRLVMFVSFVVSSLAAVFPFMLTVASYICIIVAILRIPSSTGRQKAFSTCSSHLIVVTVFYSTLLIVYMIPNTNTLRDLNKVFSVFYTVLTPLVNPLIYSLRNKEVQVALARTIGRFINSTKKSRLIKGG